LQAPTTKHPEAEDDEQKTQEEPSDHSPKSSKKSSRKMQDATMQAQKLKLAYQEQTEKDPKQEDTKAKRSRGKNFTWSVPQVTKLFESLVELFEEKIFVGGQMKARTYTIFFSPLFSFLPLSLSLSLTFFRSPAHSFSFRWLAPSVDCRHWIP
jgi:hypothetical protein